MRNHRILAGIAGLCLAGMASAAHAACDVSVSQQGGTQFGKVIIRGTAATTFTIAANGSVIQNPSDSTGAIVTQIPTNFRYRVTVTTGASCSNHVTIKLTSQSIGTPTLTFPANAFNVAGVSGISGTLNTTVANGGTFAINTTGSGNGAIFVFDVGSSFILPANAVSGNASWTVKVEAS